MNMQIYVITVIKIKILIFYRMNKIIYGFILFILILMLIIYYWNNIFFYENFKSENNIFNNTKKTFLLK